MLKQTFTKIVIAGTAATLIALPAQAQSKYPSKSIEFVIPFGAGGGADIEGRLLAKEMSKILGKPVVPINKPGGGGAITYTYLTNAKPDGHTVAWNSTSVLTTTNIGNTKFDYNAMDHIGQVEYQPMPFVVKADSKWNSFKDFAKDCKANPNKYKIAFAGVGSATHLAAIALTQAADCKAIMLPVKAPERNAKVLSGEADAAMHIFTNPLKLVKAKKVKFLVLTSSERSKAVPDVPTAKELGYNVELDLFRGLSVPKGTPDDIKQKLSDAMIKAANSDSFKARAKKIGFTLAPLGIKEFDEKLKKKDADIKNIMKSAGLYKSKMKK
ncbi:MAG: Bug family tripartite tricarboxylate transporter substrate binding protein [Methyloligellaceae bacterium]